MSQERSRLIPIDPSSGAALLHMVGSGAVFDWNAACPTDSLSLSSIILRQVVRSVKSQDGVDKQLAVQTFRVDSADFPNIINQDQYTVFVTASGYFYRDEKFHGPGHHLPILPNSLNDLLFISKSRLRAESL